MKNWQSMKIESLNLDYYSDFLGEKEIRLYTNSKGIIFKKNIQEITKNHFCEIQLGQGENDIYFFSFWDGYFDTLIRELMNCEENYTQLPNFIKNWNECKGWSDIESNPDVITKEELKWLNKNIPIINEQFRHDSEKSVWNYNCFYDLSQFLSFVEKNDWELRICEE